MVDKLDTLSMAIKSIALLCTPTNSENRTLGSRSLKQDENTHLFETIVNQTTHTQLEKLKEEPAVETTTGS